MVVLGGARELANLVLPEVVLGVLDSALFRFIVEITVVVFAAIMAGALPAFQDLPRWQRASSMEPPVAGAQAEVQHACCLCGTAPRDCTLGELSEDSSSMTHFRSFVCVTLCVYVLLWLHVSAQGRHGSLRVLLVLWALGPAD